MLEGEGDAISTKNLPSNSLKYWLREATATIKVEYYIYFLPTVFLLAERQLNELIVIPHDGEVAVQTGSDKGDSWLNTNQSFVFSPR